MKKYYLLILIFSFSFSGIKIGIDIGADINFDEGGSDDLEMGISLAYETNKKNSKYNFGLEYLFPTELDDSDAEISILTGYAKYEFFNDNSIKLSGIIGYSFPDIDVDGFNPYQLDGGLMFGFEANYGRINFAYTIHNGELELDLGSLYSYYGYYGYNSGSFEQDITLNRLTLSYLF